MCTDDTIDRIYNCFTRIFPLPWARCRLYRQIRSELDSRPYSRRRQAAAAVSSSDDEVIDPTWRTATLPGYFRVNSDYREERDSDYNIDSASSSSLSSSDDSDIEYTYDVEDGDESESTGDEDADAPCVSLRDCRDGIAPMNAIFVGVAAEIVLEHNITGERRRFLGSFNSYGANILSAGTEEFQNICSRRRFEEFLRESMSLDNLILRLITRRGEEEDSSWLFHSIIGLIVVAHKRTIRRNIPFDILPPNATTNRFFVD